MVHTGSFKAVMHPAFKGPIPIITLHGGYDQHVYLEELALGRPRDWQSDSVLADVMSLDTWLSICSRTPEIYDGKNALLRQMPALAKRVIEEFVIDFLDLQTGVDEGGLEDVQAVKDNVMDFLSGEESSDAEMMFALVSILRTTKIALCISTGQNTSDLRDFFALDAKAYLV